MRAAKTKVLGTLLRRPPRYGINAAAVPLSLGVPTYIRITDIDESGRFSPDPKVGVDHPKSSDYRMKSGELVFARTGASVGKSYLYDPRDGELVYAGFLISIAPDPEVLNPKYLSLFAQSKDYWDWIARTSVRSGQPGVNAREYAQLPVRLPNIAVQNAIADAMTDVDALIDALVRLIAKKQAIKQGMMQQLLTGNTRLPGFSTPWREVTIGDLAGVTGGGTPSTRISSLWGGGIPWFTPAEIPESGAGVVTKSDRTITEAGLQKSAAKLLPEGTVLVTSRASIGNCAIAGCPVTTNQGFTSLVPKDRRSTEFLYYWVQQQRARFVSRSAGSTFLEISGSKVAGIEILAPDAAEQAAIGTVLTEADAELRSLRKRLTKAREIKHGMMQELLTGRTRMPIEVAT